MDEERLKSWIVKIFPSKEAEEAEGAGFWAAEGGYVLTCTHVVQDEEGMDPRPPWVGYGEKRVLAKVVDKKGDITLLQVEGMEGKIAPLGTEWKRDDIIDSLGYQYEQKNGIDYFPMKGIILGEAKKDDMETITIEEAIHVTHGASGAPAFNRRTGKVVGIISNKWEQKQVGFVLSLSNVLGQWDILAPRFHLVDHGQDDIFEYYKAFVGRKEEIKAVQDLLDSDGGDYFLIQGKAGMGKTALVAELARKGAQKDPGPQVSCLVFFIREEGGRNTREVFLDTLNRQLMQLLEEGEEVPISLPEKKRQYDRLWEKVESQVSSSNRVLVLIDGLDESAKKGKQPLIEYIPSTVAPYVYWLLTSRPLPDVLSAVPTTHFLRKARSRWLAGLGPQEVRELLNQAGDQIQRSDDFIKKLLDRTKGEPLFLRFLCQDIAGWGEEAQKHLQEIPRETKEYFQRQFKLLWERRREAYDRNLPLDILKVLLVSFSGMTTEELAGVLDVPSLDVRENIELIERFLLGKDSYELMHLEFRRTAEEQLLARQEEKQEVLEKLLAYCKKHWGKRSTKETYALRHYLRHLRELKHYQEMFDLCNAGYLEVKLGRLISPELLEEDYRHLYAACKELEDLEGLLRWGFHRARISDEVAAFSKIRGVPGATAKLAQRGRKNQRKRWWDRGVVLCALASGVQTRVDGLLRLCEGLEPVKKDVPEKVFERIHDLLKEIPSGENKDALIGEYVKQLCRWETSDLGQALEVATQIGDEESRSEALSSVLQVQVQMMKISRAVDILSGISTPNHFLQACVAIFKTGESLPANEAGAMFIDSLYRIFPFASVHERYVFLKAAQQVLPFLRRHLPQEQFRRILLFLEEQCRVG